MNNDDEGKRAFRARKFAIDHPGSRSHDKSKTISLHPEAATPVNGMLSLWTRPLSAQPKAVDTVSTERGVSGSLEGKDWS